MHEINVCTKQLSKQSCQNIAVKLRNVLQFKLELEMGNICRGAEEVVSISTIINIGIPHVSDSIFGHLSDSDLIQCQNVSKLWKLICQDVIYKRWKGNLLKPFIDGNVGVGKVLLGLLEIKGDYGLTPLMVACQNGRVKMLKTLLAHPGIDLNARDESGLTAFMWACRRGHWNVVRLLLKQHLRSGNLDVDAKDVRGETAFMMACQYGHIDVVRRLLYSFIFFDDSDHYGETGMVKACLCGNVKVVETILTFYDPDFLTIPKKHPRFDYPIYLLLSHHHLYHSHSKNSINKIRRGVLPAFYYTLY